MKESSPWFLQELLQEYDEGKKFECEFENHGIYLHIKPFGISLSQKTFHHPLAQNLKNHQLDGKKWLN